MILEKNNDFINELNQIIKEFDEFKLIINKNYVFKYNFNIESQLSEITVPELMTFKIKKENYQTLFLDEFGYFYFLFENNMVKLLIEDIKALIVSINNLDHMMYFKLKDNMDFENMKDLYDLNNFMKRNRFLFN